MNNAYTWYQTLDKPFWAPPSWVFGPVWTVLYILIILSFGTVFYRTIQGKLPWTIAIPFLLNVVFNLLFTPIQFGLKNNLLACIDIILTLGTLVWAVVAIYPFTSWISYINIPYVLWGTFATILQITITILNWK